MQKTITPYVADAPQRIFESLNGDFASPNRLTFTIVGPGTLWVDTDPGVTEGTGVPFAEGAYGSDEYFRHGQALYGVAGAGESIDLRYIAFGPKGTSEDA